MGLNFLSIVMTVLEFSTVILFAAGGYEYYRIRKITADRKKSALALCGVISCFIGGFPNACDKASMTFFDYDTWFNSTWMFFFVGIGYVCLFLSVLDRKKKEKILLLAVPAFHKPMKYMSMLAASVGMTGFYVTMYRKTKKLIGKKALLYFVTFGTTVFLIVFSAAAKFSSPLPNIIAQAVNSTGYLAFIAANRAVLGKLSKAEN